MKDLSVAALLDVYGAFLSDRQRTLMAHYYNDDLSFAEIAENEGTTRQAVCDLVKRGEAQLRAWEAQCRYGALFAELETLCAAEDATAKRLRAALDEMA